MRNNVERVKELWIFTAVVVVLLSLNYAVGIIRMLVYLATT
jgi:hypothetical protein